jgi:hypothetical protein
MQVEPRFCRRSQLFPVVCINVLFLDSFINPLMLLHVLHYAARMNKCVEARNPQSSPECEQKPAVYNGTMINGKSNKFAAVVTQNQSNKPTDADKGAKDIVRNVLEGMPSVSTRGDGPNGKRIEGFLYRYRKGEEVRIVCVCHGNFLSPAEFVKHAGGGDVAHPLKHIVVNPTPFL